MELYIWTNVMHQYIRILKYEPSENIASDQTLNIANLKNKIRDFECLVGCTVFTRYVCTYINSVYMYIHNTLAWLQYRL
jgi:hypothetical protein